MQTPLPEPTVYLVDDDAEVRQSLARLLEEDGLPCVTFTSVEEFFAHWNPEAAGCVVVDFRLPGHAGLSPQALLQERGMETPLVFISSQGDVEACRRAFHGGAVDFLTKPVDEQALLASIHTAIQRDSERHRNRQEAVRLRERIAQLSDRERQVLQLMLEGMPNKLIAREIGLSTRTVESHRSRIYLKLEADSLAKLVRFVVRLETSST